MPNQPSLGCLETFARLSSHSFTLGFTPPCRSTMLIEAGSENLFCLLTPTGMLVLGYATTSCELTCRPSIQTSWGLACPSVDGPFHSTAFTPVRTYVDRKGYRLPYVTARTTNLEESLPILTSPSMATDVENLKFK